MSTLSRLQEIQIVDGLMDAMRQGPLSPFSSESSSGARIAQLGQVEDPMSLLRFRNRGLFERAMTKQTVRDAVIRYSDRLHGLSESLDGVLHVSPNVGRDFIKAARGRRKAMFAIRSVEKIEAASENLLEVATKYFREDEGTTLEHLRKALLRTTREVNPRIQAAGNVDLHKIDGLAIDMARFRRGLITFAKKFPSNPAAGLLVIGGLAATGWAISV
jgi:hypothetical protein